MRAGAQDEEKSARHGGLFKVCVKGYLVLSPEMYQVVRASHSQ